MGGRFWTAAAVLGLGSSLFGAAVSAAQVTPTADLAIISNTATVRHAKVGDVVAFTIVAKNNGPDPTSMFIDAVHTMGSLKIVSLTCDRHINADGTHCEYDVPLQPGETLTETLRALVQATGSRFATNTTCAYFSSLNDSNPANDCGTAVVRIIGPRQTCLSERARIGRTAFGEKYGLGRYHLFALRRCMIQASK